MASERLGEVLTLAATGAQMVGTVALNYTQGHPARVGFAAVSLGLAPVLGAGWMVALPLKAMGFGQAGVGAGSVAAWLQGAAYGVYIPAGSSFAALQAVTPRLGSSGLGRSSLLDNGHTRAYHLTSSAVLKSECSYKVHTRDFGEIGLIPSLR
ncbi:MAG: hypothetical protein M1830_003964 [Pleopsidium flavum]|nr:MAG: hypothetical protein M1830_003964 [Pleopsidium flavum]